MGKQEEVSIFMSQYDLDIKPEYRALDVAAELGEVASQMLADSGYGDQAIRGTDDLEDEIGDLYFSLIALANRLNIDLDMALEDALEKYERRIEQDSSPSSAETQQEQQDTGPRDFAPDHVSDRGDEEDPA